MSFSSNLLISVNNSYNIFAGIIDNSTDSLFTYATGEDFTTFFDPAFNPEFQPTFSDPGLEAQASDICGDDAFCLFDIAATGRTDIGLATVVGSQTFDDIVALSTASKYFLIRN